MTYRLNAEELKLIDKALNENVDYFTDYYLRGPNSGTWWLPGAKTDRWKIGYDRLLEMWTSLNKPESFTYFGQPYQVMWDHENKKLFPTLPAFHNHHGILMLPWGKELHLDRHPVRTIIGGKGSSKTWAEAISILVNGATLPEYRAFVLAPYSYQCLEVYKQMQVIMRNTLYYERFHINSVTRPTPVITIANSLVGESTIEFFPIKESPEKLLTMTGDEAMCDQSEQIDNLDDLIDIVGTRFRGRLPSSGRSRLGRLTFIANSNDNQQLWDYFEKADTDPDFYYSRLVSSYDNPYLTERDIANFEKFVGGDAESIRVHLKGERPRGNGKEFSRDVLERVESEELDQMMQRGLDAKQPGYVMLKQPGVGVHEWLLPYDPKRKYLVVTDPGTANPPDRNSPPIFVWDITKFPDQPMTLAGFVWVYGDNNIKNWATRFAEIVTRYQAKGSCAMDATGYQAGYDTWMAILDNLWIEKINLSGGMKAHCLNAAKIVTSRGLVKIPRSLDNVFAQLARYDYAEDKPGSKLRQDIVMAFIMSMWWSQRLWYFDDAGDQEAKPYDRLGREKEDRYASHPR